MQKGTEALLTKMTPPKTETLSVQIFLTDSPLQSLAGDGKIKM